MDDNLRRGNNTENLGLHLLRTVGAVAPVPRDQDIGIDAILTLLKRDRGRRLVSGSNIFVQLKSSTVRKVVFTSADLEWLHRLELPYVIGSVNSADASISLYTVHAAVDLIGTKSVKAELCLDLEAKCVNAAVDGEERFEEWFVDDADRSVTTKIYLGPPILVWKLNDSNDPSFLAKSNEVLESWVAIFHENRLLEPMGESLTVVWKTGSLPEQSGSVSAYRAGDNSCQPAVRLFNTAIKRISMEAALNGNVEALQSLLDTVSHLKPHGVEDRDVIAAGVVAGLRSKPR